MVAATSVPDFSDSVDAQINSSSGLDLIEPNLELWFDASNIDTAGNSTITNGDISLWNDLSGNSYHASQDTSSYSPIFQSSDNSLVFDGTDDYFPIKDKFYTYQGIDNINIFAVIKSSSNDRQIIISYDRSEFYRFSLITDVGNKNWDLTQQLTWVIQMILELEILMMEP